MSKTYCEECSGEAIDHTLTYMSVAFDDALNPLLAHGTHFKTLAGLIYTVETRLTPHILELLVRVGVAQKIRRPDDETILLAQVLWNEARERGIDMWEFRFFGLPRNIFVAKWPAGKKVAFEGMPLPDRSRNQVWWMDDKAEMKKRFTELGFPVAKGGADSDVEDTIRRFKTLVPPVIVKPHSGSGSRHTTLHITDLRELCRAFAVAKQVSPKVLVEEELVGPVYRATVVDGKLAATLRRDQPCVFGDGIHTIRELVAEENTHPARSGPYFSKIILNQAAETEVLLQGLTFDSIPPAGERVQFHQKVNWGVGGTTTDVTDEVHPDNRKLFEDVAQALSASLVGIDFIISDISKSWKDTARSGVIECNSMPFFDNHHLPFKGEVRNVAGAILDMVEKDWGLVQEKTSNES